LKSELIEARQMTPTKLGVEGLTVPRDEGIARVL